MNVQHIFQGTFRKFQWISKYFERWQIRFQNRRIEFTRQRSVVILFTVVSLETLTKHRAISSSTTNSTRNHPVIASMRRRQTTLRDASSASERSIPPNYLSNDFVACHYRHDWLIFQKINPNNSFFINPMINQSPTDNNRLTIIDWLVSLFQKLRWHMGTANQPLFTYLLR